MEKNFLKIHYLPIYISIAVIVGIFVGNKINLNTPSNTFQSNQNDSNVHLNKLNDVLSIVNENYVDTVDFKKIVESGIEHMLHELDPHSAYIPAQDAERENEDLYGKFEGVGILFGLYDDTITVLKPIEGGPSAEAGILPGDKIIMVEEEMVAGQNFKINDVVNRLRGERGSEVNISVYRFGEGNLLPFTITRSEIPLYSIDASYLINDSTIYFRIKNFSATTSEEFDHAVKTLKAVGKQNVIIDLRGNLGGYLSPSTRLADEFLTQGKMIVYTEGLHRERKNVVATDAGVFHNSNLLVLVNHESASASEIFAGAIQDNDRGKIIGSSSFGKGLVQEPINFNDGSQLRITVSRYYTPSGRCIQKPYKGVSEADYAYGLYDHETKIDSTDTHKTASGRTVYGGGGIYPDIHVTNDTTINFSMVNTLYDDEIIQKFTISYFTKNHENLFKLDVNQLINDDKLASNLFLLLQGYANRKMDKNVDFQVNEATRQYITTSLKANLAKSLWGNSEYHQVMNSNDKVYQAALSEIKKGS